MPTDARTSSTAALSSSQPLSTAAFIMAYSPDTWYAEMGRCELSLSRRITSK